MTARIQIKRGNHADKPTSGLLIGEPLVTLDRGNLHVASSPTTTFTVTPAIDELSTIPAIAAGDYLMVHDLDGAGKKEVKVPFSAFKTALNIPAASTDELVAIVSGGTAGYIWGTDGTDGVFRMGPSMSWVKDAGDNFVTLNVAIVDGGTFV